MEELRHQALDAIVSDFIMSTKTSIIELMIWSAKRSEKCLCDLCGGDGEIAEDGADADGNTEKGTEVRNCPECSPKKENFEE